MGQFLGLLNQQWVGRTRVCSHVSQSNLSLQNKENNQNQTPSTLGLTDYKYSCIPGCFLSVQHIETNCKNRGFSCTGSSSLRWVKWRLIVDRLQREQTFCARLKYRHVGNTSHGCSTFLNCLRDNVDPGPWSTLLHIATTLLHKIDNLVCWPEKNVNKIPTCSCFFYKSFSIMLLL